MGSDVGKHPSAGPPETDQHQRQIEESGHGKLEDTQHPHQRVAGDQVKVRLRLNETLREEFRLAEAGRQKVRISEIYGYRRKSAHHRRNCQRHPRKPL